MAQTTGLVQRRIASPAMPPPSRHVLRVACRACQISCRASPGHTPSSGGSGLYEQVRAHGTRGAEIESKYDGAIGIGIGRHHLTVPWHVALHRRRVRRARRPEVSAGAEGLQTQAETD